MRAAEIILWALLAIGGLMLVVLVSSWLLLPGPAPAPPPIPASPVSSLATHQPCAARQPMNSTRATLALAIWQKHRTR